MKKLPCRSSTEAGFTLAELAIVLLIVSLLVGGLLGPLSAQIDLRHSSDTRKSLEEIREALLGFAAVHGRLPCPAVSTTASDVAGAGLEVPPPSAGVCPNPDASGILPWATLGVSETDAWGRRYSYRVTNVFAQSVPPPALPPPPTPCTASASAAFVLCSTDTLHDSLDVFSSLATPGSVVARDVPVVVISHGKNGNGAYTPQGRQLPASTDPDERENALNPGGTAFANNDFVSKAESRTFDDQLMWIAPGVLFNRMITVGKLP